MWRSRDEWSSFSGRTCRAEDVDQSVVELPLLLEKSTLVKITLHLLFLKLPLLLSVLTIFIISNKYSNNTVRLDLSSLICFTVRSVYYKAVLVVRFCILSLNIFHLNAKKAQEMLVLTKYSPMLLATDGSRSVLEGDGSEVSSGRRLFSNDVWHITNLY